MDEYWNHGYELWPTKASLYVANAFFAVNDTQESFYFTVKGGSLHEVVVFATNSHDCHWKLHIC